MDTHDLHAEIVLSTAQAVKKAREVYKSEIPFPEIDISLQGTVGGCMCYDSNTQKWTVRVNLEMAQDDLKYYTEEIIPHEIAHMVAWIVHQEKGHGFWWKRVMQDCYNLAPNRLHKMDVKKYKTRTVPRDFVYTCPCREHKVTKTLHRRMSKGQIRQCTTCKGTLTYNREEKEDGI